MRIIQILAILLIAISLVFTACSSTASTTTPSPTQQSTTPTSSPDPTKFEIVEQGGKFIIADPVDNGRIIDGADSLEEAQRKLDLLIRKYNNSKNNTSDNKVETSIGKDAYVVAKYDSFGDRNETTMILKTIGRWEGNGNEVIEFSTDVSPIVLNYEVTNISKIKSSFQLYILGGNIMDNPMVKQLIDDGWWGQCMASGAVYEGTGEYKLKVVSSGCDWMIKIGVEK